MSDIAKNLKKVRESKGVTQTELAKVIGKSAQAVSAWECAKAEPSSAMIEKIAKALDVKKEDIYGRSSSDDTPLNFDILNAMGCTEEEMLLLKKFREATDWEKDIVRVTLRVNYKKG